MGDTRPPIGARVHVRNDGAYGQLGDVKGTVMSDDDKGLRVLLDSFAGLRRMSIYVRPADVEVLPPAEETRTP